MRINPNNKTANNIFYIWFALIIIVGGVMSAGLALMGYYLIPASHDRIEILMLGVLFPMAIVMWIGIRILMRHMNSKIDPLLMAIHEVSEGNLDVELDEKYGGEYRKLYEDFNKMSKELRLTKEEMQTFVNEFTHEFKTPITSISGFADLLYESGEELDKETREEYLKLISEQAHRLSNLSQNTLLLSKVEATQIITDKEEFDLGSQLQSCAILFLKKMEERNITLTMAEELNLTYFGNEELMEQVWINLIGNALKFTPDGGKIRIDGGVKEKQIWVSIQDSGCGMSEETISHIFDKYYQHDTQNIVKGNGIGLSIVKRIVDLCHGEVRVESAPGQGSKFTVIL